MKYMKTLYLRIVITVLVLLVAGVHIFIPSLQIDLITLTLIVLGIIPWLAPLFKSLEFPGGWKFEFQELEKATSEVKASGLLSEVSVKDQSKYEFDQIAVSNPVLALASLRIELEKSLKKLAEYGGIKNNPRGIRYLTNDLFQNQLISQQEKSALDDMVDTLNRAVHGDELDYRATQWVIETGPKILHGIDKRIYKSKKAK